LKEEAAEEERSSSRKKETEEQDHSQTSQCHRHQGNGSTPIQRSTSSKSACAKVRPVIAQHAYPKES
jgi:hypothetical protein